MTGQQTSNSPEMQKTIVVIDGPEVGSCRPNSLTITPNNPISSNNGTTRVPSVNHLCQRKWFLCRVHNGIRTWILPAMTAKYGKTKSGNGRPPKPVKKVWSPTA